MRRLLLIVLMAGTMCVAQAADALPDYLTGMWGSSATLFDGRAAQTQLYLAADGLGIMSGSSPVPASAAVAADASPPPRAIVGVPVRAEVDGAVVRLQVLIPHPIRQQAVAGMVFVCRYEAAVPALVCTGPARQTLNLPRRSASLAAEVVTQLEQLRATLPH